MTTEQNSREAAHPEDESLSVMPELSHLDIRHSQGSYMAMSSDKKSPPPAADGNPDRPKPVWADGLKRMYDEVVKEDLPDEFVELLKKLDGAGGTH